MKQLFTISIFAFAAQFAAAQISTPPSGDNQKASVTQWIGLVSVTITTAALMCMDRRVKIVKVTSGENWSTMDLSTRDMDRQRRLHGEPGK